jgi:hypothetical protein
VCIFWTRLARFRGKWQVFVNTVTNLRDQERQGSFLCNISRNIINHIVSSYKCVNQFILYYPCDVCRRNCNGNVKELQNSCLLSFL